MSDRSIGNLPLEADRFQVGRMAALQPRLELAQLSQSLMRTEDPAILNNITNLVRIWAFSRHDLPGDYCERVQVRSVARQPLSFVIADAEFVNRKVVQRRDPYSDQRVDAGPWPTNDPFKLIALDEPSFPDQAVDSELPLEGQQSVRGCDHCQGAGSSPCTACGASGIVACSGCGGTQRVTCSRCNGAGLHVGVRGRLVNCQLCSTRGTVRCTACGGKGTVGCATCSGQGNVMCVTCLGFGNLLVRWAVQQRTTTRSKYLAFAPSTWPFPSDELMADCDLTWSASWPADSRQTSDVTLKGLPQPLRSHADSLVAEQFEHDRAAIETGKRLIALRVRVLGTYVYRVVCEYQGRQEALLLGGARSRVFTSRSPQRKAGWLRRTTTWSRRKLSLLWNGELASLDRKFFEGVQAGEVHIADTRCLVQDLRKLIDGKIEQSEGGYNVAFRPSGNGIAPPTIEISWDLDPSGQVILCLGARLGAVQRDAIPTLLRLNYRISFGRFAVRVDPTSKPELMLVDRRQYNMIKPTDLAVILRCMASDLRQLRKNKVLD